MTVVKTKNQKEQKGVIKSKCTFENLDNCLEAAELDNEKSYLDENKMVIDILKKRNKQFIKTIN